MSAALIDLPTEVAFGKFHPVAYYDKHMDCIRVITRDVSVTESRISREVTLLEANHRGEFDSLYVGFVLKGISHLFDSLSLPLQGAYTLAQILDTMIKKAPGSTVTNAVKLVLQQLDTASGLTVQMDLAA